MKQDLVNLLKYNKTIYVIYHGLFSVLINFLKLFVKTDDHVILFNSFAGRQYDDSPKEIFMAMKDDPRFKGHKFVWALHAPEKYEIPGAEVIKTDTLRYFITAIKARVWVTNSSVERGLSFKGKHTLYFNTWHGTPIKKMGSDISADNRSFGMRRNRPSVYDVFCSQGMFETDIFSRSFNIPKERILKSGLPRNDILADHTEEQRAAIRNKLNIKENQTVLLYCPTFREYEKDKKLGVVLAPPIDLRKWERKLGSEYVVFFRAHYEVSRMMEIQENDLLRNMTAYPSMNELMIAADILISDYSSVFFDYSITGKPMLQFCYDYEKYCMNRGVYFDIRDWVDGADNEDDLLEKIKKTTLGRSEKTITFRNRYLNYYGSATKRCVDRIAEKIL